MINATFFGETGKAEIKYFFKNGSKEDYLAIMTDSHYSSPISNSRTKVASIVINKLFVCGDEVPNYPGSVEIINSYNRIKSVLKAILGSD